MGFRRELARATEDVPQLGFVEVLAEHLNHRGQVPASLARLKARGVQVVLHGISLSLGSAETLSMAQLDRLAFLAEALEAPLVSEHVAFVRGGGREAGHLLPVPRTPAALEVLVENVRLAQRVLPVPLALENIASLLEWPGEQIGEPEFLRQLCDATGTQLLLDVSNLYANHRNLGWDVHHYLSRYPVERVAYVHVAGGVEHDGLYHDTHAHPLGPGPLEVLAALAELRAPPGILWERDDRFPAGEELRRELEAVRPFLARGST